MSSTPSRHSLYIDFADSSSESLSSEFEMEQYMSKLVSCNVGVIQPYQSDAPSRSELVIHHQFPGVELVSPVYAFDGAKCYLPPDQRVDAGSTTQVGFNVDLVQEEAEGALMYKLKKKNIDQSNEETMSSEEAVCIQLVMVWGFSYLNIFSYVRF
jgi:hypothetical protein